MGNFLSTDMTTEVENSTLCPVTQAAVKAPQVTQTMLYNRLQAVGKVHKGTQIHFVFRLAFSAQCLHDIYKIIPG